MPDARTAAGITPAPTEEEAAAIVAAVEACWPRPGAVSTGPADRSIAWRFSGRWWRRDRFGAVERPWN